MYILFFIRNMEILNIIKVFIIVRGQTNLSFPSDIAETTMPKLNYSPRLLCGWKGLSERMSNFRQRILFVGIEKGTERTFEETSNKFGSANLSCMLKQQTQIYFSTIHKYPHNS